MTGSPYLQTMPRQDDLWKNPEWYVTCLDGAFYGKTAHAETVWSDGQGRIWVESTRLGSATDWVERAYGEEGAVRAMDLDYQNLSIDEVQERLRAFPVVTDFIENCKKALARASSRTGLELEMVSDGRKGEARFLFRAKVGSGRDLNRRLRKAVLALKWAYDRSASERMIIEGLSGLV